jgi:hypothetical protein
MRFLIFLLAILFLTADCFANDKIYLEETDSYWGHPVLLKGNNVYGSSWGGYDLSEIVKDNPAALEYAKEYSHYYNATWITGIPWLASLILAAVTQDNTTFWISFGAFVVVTVPFFHFGSRTRYFLYKTINTYNGMAESDSHGHSSLDIGFKVLSSNDHHDPGLGLTLSF